MAGYDFTGLSPSDFETLCRDLLERSLAIPLQAFTTGRDKGIDLRHAPVEGQDLIVQCKHFARSGYPKLRSHLLKMELPKIKRLRPQRYVLATSVGLSPPNVNELFDLLSPYCRSKHDIIGKDDLNSLLRSNPTTEQAHFKLWLTSEAVLSRVLHNNVFVQSLLTEDQIKQRLGLYVHTESFDAARQKLEEEHVCILSGVPGVGKTTLAEMLLVEYLADDWEVIAIHQNVAEGLMLFRPDANARQVFYYDDFLGQISTGEKLGKNEDRTLLQLIRSVSRTANKRFVLTTREYILANAKAEHEHLARSKIDLHQFVVSCDDYSVLDKARILANHLYFAQVPQKHIAALVEQRTYRDIISHRNYNPRIIEWMTQITETSACCPRAYPSVFLDRLENPSDLWTHAFENQISEAARHLLLVLGSCGDGTMVSDLREAFDSFFTERGKLYGFQTAPSSFKKALDELEGNFIRIDRTSSELVVSCHNPSILDFLDQRFSTHMDELTDILRFAVFFEQVQRLFQVFDVGDTRKQGRDKSGLDARVIEQAIGRTLLARSIRLVQVDRGTGRWYCSPISIWERLRLCCRIGAMSQDAKLRHAIQEHVSTHLGEIVRHPGELGDILPLYDVLDNSKWIKRELVERWHEQMWDMLLKLESKYKEPLDGLAVVAQWFVDNRRRFDSVQAEAFEESLANAVRHEVEYNTEHGDPERVGGDLATLEEIANTLQRDFSEEIDWLSESLAECGRRGDDDGDGWSGRRAASCTSSIESLFDALIE
jgi:hypothetical protein